MTDMKASIYKYILSIVFSVLIFSCTSNNGSVSNTPEIKDSIKTDTLANIDFTDETLNVDSVICSLFGNPESFDQKPEHPSMRYSLSEDGKVKVISVREDKILDHGTSYVQYKKENGDVVLKKVAYPYMDEKEGRVRFPDYLAEIHYVKDGYIAYGALQIDSDENYYRDTLFISNTFLNSDKWEMEHK